MVLPTLELIKTLMKADEDDTPLAGHIKVSVISYLCDKYHEDTANLELLRTAAYLDPRFKNNYLSQESAVIAELKAGKCRKQDIL